MKRPAFAFLLLLLLLLAGCERPQSAGPGASQSAGAGDAAPSESTAYASRTSSEDCILCGGGIKDLIPAQWGQNNIALISLNTLALQPVEINRYENGQLIEEFAGFCSLGGGKSGDSGFSASLTENYDRGYASGYVYFNGDEALDMDKAARFLCESCLNRILPVWTDRCFGVGALHLATGEIGLFTEDTDGFLLGDFYIDCDPREGPRAPGSGRRMKLTIFYCPPRYEKEP